MSKENNPNLTEMIKEIHDGVAREMYCKGIDDFVKACENNQLFPMYGGYVYMTDIKEIAEQLKAKFN